MKRRKSFETFAVLPFIQFKHQQMNYRRIEKYFLMINVYSLTTDIFSKRPLETYLYGKNQNMKRYMKRFSLYGIENDIINH